MPLRLDVKKKLSQPSDRVKCVDMHPTEPWIITALYSGHVFIWNYSSQAMVKSFEIGDLPVRCVAFIARKQWFVTGSDDMELRCYNYNTMEKVHSVLAHTDYIRSLAVHPTQPYVITSSDDLQIKLWDWEKGWANTCTFEGHAHYVMQVKFNPKDTNTFASASLDRSVKVWGLSSPVPNFSLEGHERGVNCVDYYPGGDKPYIISGSDDGTLMLWDYQTKSCVSTFEGHTNNVVACCFHPKLPVILSGSEDGTVRIWHNTTYRLETTLNYGKERAWSLAVTDASNKVGIGYDEGCIVIKLGQEVPVCSMDNGGKVVWANNQTMLLGSVRGLIEEGKDEDGERVALRGKELGAVEVFPQTVRHDPRGRFVAVCGDGEWIIYTAQALRNKAFGSGLDFVWSGTGSGDFAVRESTSRIKIFKNFKEHRQFRPPFSAEAIFGGALLGVRGQDFVVFYDWDTDKLIRRIDENPRAVYWSDSGELVTLACADSYYVLKYDADAVLAASLATGAEAETIAEEGVEAAFDLAHDEIGEKVRTGQWVGDCFLYTNSNKRLNYCVGGHVITLAHLDRSMYMLGYIAKEGRVYLIDKTNNVTAYSIALSILEYQTAVVRRDFDEANRILEGIDPAQYDGIARFLEGQGFKEEAMAVATDPEVKFELALELRKLDAAMELMRSSFSDGDATTTQLKWKQLSDLALVLGDHETMQACAAEAGDLPALLLMHTCYGNAAGMHKLVGLAIQQKRFNVAFVALFLLGRVEDCIELLLSTGRIPEAAFLARTYMPSDVPRVVELWKADLAKVSKRAADSLADPSQYANLFPDLAWALKAEALFKRQRDTPVPAAAYPRAKNDLDLNLIEAMKSLGDIDAPLPGDAPAEGGSGASASAGAGAGAGASPTAAPDSNGAAAGGAAGSPAASPIGATAGPSGGSPAASPASPAKAASPAPAAAEAPAAAAAPAPAAAEEPAGEEDEEDEDEEAAALRLSMEIEAAAGAAAAAGGADGDGGLGADAVDIDVGDGGADDDDTAALEAEIADLDGDEWGADDDDEA